jgi:hypothetical protein
VTKEEAIAVVAVVRSGGVPQEFAPSTIEQWEDYLLPLPHDYCIRAARRWVLSVPVDEHGQPVPKFVSEPSAVLTGCGVPFGARDLVDRALRDGGEVYPSVRGRVSDGGWEYVAPDDPLPRGVGEWYANAGLPLPPDRHLDPALEAAPTRPALAPGEPITEEQRMANLQRLGSLARGLGASKAVGAEPRPVRASRVPRGPAPTVSPSVIEAELRRFDERWREATL